MTALDQALIRAFQQQGATPLTLPPQPAPKASPQRTADRSTVQPRAAAAPTRPPASEAPAALSLSDVFSGVLAALEKSPPQAAMSEHEEGGQSSCGSSATEAVEEPNAFLRAIGTPPPVEGAAKPRTSQSAVSNSPPIEIGGTQWMLGNEQWIVGGGQWASTGGQYVPDNTDEVSLPLRSKAKGIELPPTAASVAPWQAEPPVSYEPPPTTPHRCVEAEPPRQEPSREPRSRASEQRVASTEPQAIPGRAAVALKPAWQVDRFTWPRVCRRLMAEAIDEWDRLCDALLTAAAQGQKVLAITGCHRGEGATTLLLCAASRLAERGIKTALVDADLRRPRIAKRLGVQPQDGWDEVCGEDGSGLERAIVESTTGGIAVLPLRDLQNEQKTLNWPQLAACLERLRSHYEMVLVDLGPLEDTDWTAGAPGWATPGGIDAVLLACDRRLTAEEQLSETGRRLIAAGMPVAGMIENFSRTEEPCTSHTGG